LRHGYLLEEQDGQLSCSVPYVKKIGEADYDKCRFCTQFDEKIGHISMPSTGKLTICKET